MEPSRGANGIPLEVVEASPWGGRDPFGDWRGPFAARVAPLGADEILFGADDTFSWGGWAPVRGWQDPFWVGWSLWKRTGSPLRRTVPFGNGRCPLWGGWTFFEVARASFWSSLVPESEGLCGRLGLVWGLWDRLGLSGRLAILIELNKCRLGRWPRCVLGWKA